MAVFGAPQALADKERAAVLAGREIIDAVRSVARSGEAPGPAEISVGAGIATGAAFVATSRQPTGGVVGATAIEEGNLAPSCLDRFGRSGRYISCFGDFDQLSHLAGLL